MGEKLSNFPHWSHAVDSKQPRSGETFGKGDQEDDAWAVVRCSPYHNTGDESLAWCSENDSWREGATSVTSFSMRRLQTDVNV